MLRPQRTGIRRAFAGFVDFRRGAILQSITAHRIFGISHPGGRGIMLGLSKRRPSRPRSPNRARYVRLDLEELESRTVPTVLTPVQVRHAYGFDQLTFVVNGRAIAGDGSGQTIAIINAY